jgi:hypothetical protein
MKTLLHASAGVCALIMLLAYFAGTTISIFLYTPQDVILVQQTILHSMWVYLPLICIAGAIGLLLSNKRKELIVKAKKRRMFLVVVFSLLGLLPSCYLLANNLLKGEQAIVLFVLEALELVFEIILIALLILNYRDGTRLTANRPTSS